MWNGTVSGTLTRLFAERLPTGWRASFATCPGGPDSGDALLQLSAPGRAAAEIRVQRRARLDGRDTSVLLSRLRSGPGRGRPVLVSAPFLSAHVRQMLSDASVGYADDTGNLRLVLERPAVFLETQGAVKDPSPAQRPLRSLRGRAAGRAVRALCDYREPYGLRELAGKAHLALGSLARVTALLDRDALLSRDDSGRIVEVRAVDLIRRWAADYTFAESNIILSCVAPRGLERLTRDLRSLRNDWCLSGTLAAQRRAPAAAPSVAILYTVDPSAAAEELGLHPADSGANVLLAEPYDRVVFERTWPDDGLRFAALPQVAVDLLTGPGRGPAEADSLLAWMASHEDAWRA